MSTKIAFFGTESYDIIHYFSRVLKNLEYSVLVIDESKESELAVSIPVPKRENLELFVVDYRGIDFKRYWMRSKIDQYNYILTYFGKNSNENLMLEHDFLYYVTDLQLHNIQRVKRVREELKDKPFVKQHLIIRDFNGLRKKRFIEHECKFNESYYLSEDITDKNLMLECQYNSIFTFRKASPDLKEMLMKMYEESGKIDRKFKVAFKRAERGK